MAVMIGVDPHKGSHTAVALDDNEEFLGELRVRSAANQVERLVAWAAPFEERTWAIEGAGGLGYLLAQQLVAAGERVVDVQPKLAARVRLLATGDTNKNDPNDARSVAVAALRAATVPEVRGEDHAKVMKVWAKRHRDLSRHRTRIACRLHAVLCELSPGGFSGEISAAQATRLLDELEPDGAVAAARHAVAVELVADLRRLDEQLRDTKKRITAAVKASKTTRHRRVRGRSDRRRDRHRRRRRHRPLPPAVTTSPPTTAPPRSRSPPGTTQGVPAVAARQPPPQPRHPHGRGHPDPLSATAPGRAYFDRKIAEGHSGKEAIRALKRRISDAIYTRLRDDAARARRLNSTGPGGQPGNDTETCAAGSHPEHRLFGQATPEPATTLRPADTRRRSHEAERTPARQPKGLLTNKEDSICAGLPLACRSATAFPRLAGWPVANVSRRLGRRQFEDRRRARHSQIARHA